MTGMSHVMPISFTLVTFNGVISLVCRVMLYGRGSVARFILVRLRFVLGAALGRDLLAAEINVSNHAHLP